MRLRLAVALVLICLSAHAAALPSPSRTIGGKITGEVRLSGAVRVTEDITVLSGAKLILEPGTKLQFDKSESTKVDPEFYFGGIEIVVRGEMSAERAEFRFSDRSGSLTVDGGKATLSDCSISGAECGLTVLGGGEAVVGGTLAVRDCRVGAAIFPGGRCLFLKNGNALLERNGAGLALFSSGHADAERFSVKGNEEVDSVSWTGNGSSHADPVSIPVPSPSATKLGDTFIESDRTLSGDVIIDGIVRVAPKVKLTVEAGSRIFITFRDTDNDGIGENGIFLQGNLDCRGTEKSRIAFYPLGQKRRGGWDSINFMSSDEGDNILEHVDIVGAYRGLHAHFSRLKASDVRISHCFRGVQFQESDMTFSGLRIDDAVSALRGRDSTVNIHNLEVTDVFSGVNLFRCVASLNRFRLNRPGWYGFRFRDGRTNISEGNIGRALVGLSLQEGSVRVESMEARESGLSGFALLEGDARIIRSNSTGSRVDALTATRAKVVFEGGELSGYGRYAVGLKGTADILLKGVSVGKSAKGAPQFHDSKIVPGLGTVRVE